MTDKFEDLLTGFSDLTRLRILFLVRNSVLSVGKLMQALDLPQSTVSRHLAFLRRSGMIKAKKHGTSKLYYFVEDEEYADVVQDIVEVYHRYWKNKEPFISDHVRAKSLQPRHLKKEKG